MPSKVSLGAAIFIVGGAIARSANAAPPDDACLFLTQAQVSAALSVSVGGGSYVTPTFKKTCTWTATGNASNGVKFATLFFEGLDAYQAGKLVGQATKTNSVAPVSGVGDEAYYLTLGNTIVSLIVKKGDAAFKVTVYGSLPIEKKQAMEKTLAQQIISKL